MDTFISTAAFDRRWYQTEPANAERFVVLSISGFQPNVDVSTLESRHRRHLAPYAISRVITLAIHCTCIIFLQSSLAVHGYFKTLLPITKLYGLGRVCAL